MAKTQITNFSLAELLGKEISSEEYESINTQIELQGWFNFLLDDLRTIINEPDRFANILAQINELGVQFAGQDAQEEMLAKLSKISGLKLEVIQQKIFMQYGLALANFVKGYWSDLKQRMPEKSSKIDELISFINSNNWESYFDEIFEVTSD